MKDFEIVDSVCVSVFKKRMSNAKRYNPHGARLCLEVSQHKQLESLFQL